MQTSEHLEMTQYLFFMLNDEKYAIQSSLIQEIVDYNPIRKVPKANKSVLGITNIRGDLVSVIDPQIILKIGKSSIQKRSSFVVFRRVNKQGSTCSSMALMVDLVIEIEDIESTNILEKPEFGTKIDKSYIQNIIHIGDEYIISLDMDYLLNIDVLSQVD